ncbi:tRNA-specific 2-thiouridylase MnmA [Glycocaulis alkaliphilus]|uniref:tRNA-specific 2-thiouridylase MnmA n=1 Tax=Glycocaulis alkaliphilus TaxID=1434191 RepID=A0A3T0EC65_9PROT|nr:tRNA 2-thiouridine(34) synthase MnmA [Glycocaulis alkaliphilus]AZU04885.1 tRNA-specific 2-thiouridylase MnmA [Glycocaulis alkaliphilus]GGB66921.1 tRNA-specific 2-thiouridylase MnmA [Glycocaulis alkaliphilus]
MTTLIQARPAGGLRDTLSANPAADTARVDALMAEFGLSGEFLGLGGNPQDHRVVAAMSGGVDSSVVGAILHRAGYQVVGMTLQLYDHGAAIHRKGACCAGQDIHDARRVAEAMGFAHYVLDYESRFKEAVMEDFADTYLAGSTPIPCVRCNQSVKFADLLSTAQQLGAAALVTGHYIRREDREGGPVLLRAEDHGKDQSYFLFATTREQLDYLRFPLGHLTKDQTRELALALGLIVAAKPDSQDICFVPDGDYASVVKRLRPDAARPGEIVHTDGRVLGLHDGVIHYTVGQRRGLGVATGEPLYVIRLDAANAQVIVGPREALAVRTIQLADVNWIGDGALVDADGMEVAVKVRSTRPPSPASLHVSADGAVSVTLAAGEEGVAPGQACVFYSVDEESRVLGGGWIRATRSEVQAA